jgi:hypothetical protein
VAICLLAIGASASWSTGLISSDSRTSGVLSGNEAQPKALILIQQLNASGAANVALTYPRVTTDSDVQKDMNEIARRTGWMISNPQTTTNTGGTPDRPSMTSVDFSVANAASPTPGALPVEPVIVALKRFPSFSIVFVMQPEFRYRGPREFRNKYVGIQFRTTGPTYTYDVQIKDPNFESLGLPLIVEPVNTNPMPRTGGRLSGQMVPLIAALCVGVVVWFIFRIARMRTPS